MRIKKTLVKIGILKKKKEAVREREKRKKKNATRREITKKNNIKIFFQHHFELKYIRETIKVSELNFLCHHIVQL